MEQKWLWIGGAGLVVVYFLFLRGGSSGAQVIPAPDTSQSDAARYNFAASGLSALGSLADKITGYNTERDIAFANAQTTMGVESMRDAALLGAAQASANAQTAQAKSRAGDDIWTQLIRGAVSIGTVLLTRGNTAPPGRNPYTGPGAFAVPVPLSGFTNHFGTTF